MNPRGPKGHRLTGEPIPDIGPRARQTARYQAPESRPNWATLQRLFSLLGSATRLPFQESCMQDSHKKREMFLEKINESGDGSGPANNP